MCSVLATMNIYVAASMAYSLRLTYWFHSTTAGVSLTNGLMLAAWTSVCCVKVDLWILCMGIGLVGPD